MLQGTGNRVFYEAQNALDNGEKVWYRVDKDQSTRIRRLILTLTLMMKMLEHACYEISGKNTEGDFPVEKFVPLRFS